MSNPFRSLRRVVLLSLVFSFGILGFALPRPESKAQQSAKATDKKELREQIGSLHAEIDLMEVEQGADRQALTELIKEERAILAAIDAYLMKRAKDSSDKTIRMTFAGTPEQQWLDQWESWGGDLLFFAKAVEWEETEAEFKKQIGKLTPEEIKKADDEVVEQFGNRLSKDLLDQLKGLIRAKNQEEYSRLQEKFVEGVLEQVTNKATGNVRKKSASLKKAFTRRSTEIAGKKLDLTILERQYLEAR